MHTQRTRPGEQMDRERISLSNVRAPGTRGVHPRGLPFFLLPFPRPRAPMREKSAILYGRFRGQRPAARIITYKRIILSYTRSPALVNDN